MFKPVQVVEVYFESSRVGKLALAPDRHCLFEYDQAWISTGFSISPFYLPLKGGVFTARAEPFDGLFGVFNDSLPDGWGRLLIDRWLVSQGVNPAGLSVPGDSIWKKIKGYMCILHQGYCMPVTVYLP